MRVTVFVVAIVLSIIALAVLLMFSLSSPVPPGQYPINTPRFEWPVSEKVAPFRPRPPMGSDEAIGLGDSSSTDTKAMCVTVSDCTGKPPSIPVVPNYRFANLTN